MITPQRGDGPPDPKPDSDSQTHDNIYAPRRCIMRLFREGARKVPKKVQKCANRASCSPEYTGKVIGLSSCPDVEQRGRGKRRGLKAVRPHV